MDRRLLTLTVPSSVVATKVRFNGSTAMPVIGRSRIFDLALPFVDTTAAASPFSPSWTSNFLTTNSLLRIPLCIFHITIFPVELPASPKFPHDVTKTERTTPPSASVCIFFRDLDVRTDAGSCFCVLGVADERGPRESMPGAPSPNDQRPRRLFCTVHVRA